MMLAVAKALMSLATCCLGESRRDWAFAMQGEFDNFDKRYRDCAPSLGELLGKHLTEHVDTFIRLV